MTYPIGSIVWGDRGVRCEVLKSQTHKTTNEVRYLIRCPDGDRYITPAQIRGHDPPRQIEVGAWVRLKGTDRIYRVLSIYSVRAGSEGITEDYCKLQTETGSAATWKLRQLELTEQ